MSNVAASPYSMSTIDAIEYEPFLVEGAPFGEVHWIRTTGVGGTVLFVGLWRAEPMVTPYVFGEDETIHALEGELKIDIADGETVVLTAGDVASFAKGTVSTWTIVKPFKKLFVISG
jgi:uncharacterized cupin superfamily protein